MLREGALCQLCENFKVHHLLLYAQYSELGRFWERTLRPHRTLRIKDNTTRLGIDLATRWISNDFFLLRIIYLIRTLYSNEAPRSSR